MSFPESLYDFVAFVKYIVVFFLFLWDTKRGLLNVFIRMCNVYVIVKVILHISIVSFMEGKTTVLVA